jgi:hypothetical protein
MHDIQDQINKIKQELFRYEKAYKNERDSLKALFAKSTVETLREQLKSLIELRDNHKK